MFMGCIKHPQVWYVYGYDPRFPTLLLLEFLAPYVNLTCGYTIIHVHTYKYIPVYICIYNILYISIIFYNTGFCQKTATHLKPQRYLAYPRNAQLQCCDRKWRASSTEMVVFLEGRQTQNSEDNIELGTGGTCPLWCGTSWDGCFFEEPGMYPLTWKPRNAVWKTGR